MSKKERLFVFIYGSSNYEFKFGSCEDVDFGLIGGSCVDVA